jgi:tetratricopeptide (TPR) repeat protein
MRRFAMWMVLCFPALCAAQEEPPEEPPTQSEERARALFTAGRAAIDEGDYEGAYRYFQESYDLSHRPELLFNLGNVAERLDRDADAIRFYTQYLEELPEAPNRTYVTTRLRVLEAGGSNEPGEEGAEEEEDGEAERARPAAPRPAGDGGVAGWAILGVGAAVAVTGVILIGVAASERSTVDGAPEGAPWSDYEGSHSLANTLAPLGGVLIGVGVAAAVVGIVIGVSSGGSRSSTDVALRVSPTELALVGRFE